MTYEQAVDFASKDFLSKGINCIQYQNGAMVNIASYAEMALRTASKRAYLMGEGVKRQEWGITTVILNKRTNACPLCMPFEGKVLIDDVWSGGKASDGDYPLMSSAIAAGLYHPNCKDKHTTYFEGVSTPPERIFTRQELDDVIERQRLENKADHATRQVKRFERLQKYSLDDENKAKYGRKLEEWKQKEQEYQKHMVLFEDANGFNLAPSSIRQAKKAGEKVNITEQAISKVKLVEIPGYTEEENRNIQLLHQKLLKVSMLENHSNEVAYILSKGRVYKVLGTVDHVDYMSSHEAVIALKDAEINSVTVLHNHPGGSTFSFEDIRFFIKTPTVKTLTIVTNQGKVMYLTKTIPVDENMVPEKVSQLKFTGNYQKDVDIVLNELYNYGVKYIRR